MSLLNLDEKKSPCGVLIDQNAWIRSTHCARCSTSPGPAWYRPPIPLPFPPRPDNLPAFLERTGGPQQSPDATFARSLRSIAGTFGGTGSIPVRWVHHTCGRHNAAWK